MLVVLSLLVTSNANVLCPVGAKNKVIKGTRAPECVLNVRLIVKRFEDYSVSSS